MMGQPPNLMGNQVPFTVNSSNVMPQHQHYQPGPNGNYSLIPQHATGAYNQPPMQNMGMQRQPNMVVEENSISRATTVTDMAMALTTALFHRTT